MWQVKSSITGTNNITAITNVTCKTSITVIAASCRPNEYN